MSLHEPPAATYVFSPRRWALLLPPSPLGTTHRTFPVSSPHSFDNVHSEGELNRIGARIRHIVGRVDGDTGHHAMGFRLQRANLDRKPTDFDMNDVIVTALRQKLLRASPPRNHPIGDDDRGDAPRYPGSQRRSAPCRDPLERRHCPNSYHLTQDHSIIGYHRRRHAQHLAPGRSAY